MHAKIKIHRTHFSTTLIFQNIYLQNYGNTNSADLYNSNSKELNMDNIHVLQLISDTIWWLHTCSLKQEHPTSWNLHFVKFVNKLTCTECAYVHAILKQYMHVYTHIYKHSHAHLSTQNLWKGYKCSLLDLKAIPTSKLYQHHKVVPSVISSFCYMLDVMRWLQVAHLDF